MSTASGQLSITWLGHSTVKITSPGGKILLIDPWVMNNPKTPDDQKMIDHLDLMLITHGHSPGPPGLRVPGSQAGHATALRHVPRPDGHACGLARSAAERAGCRAGVDRAATGPNPGATGLTVFVPCQARPLMGRTAECAWPLWERALPGWWRVGAWPGAGTRGWAMSRAALSAAARRTPTRPAARSATAR